MSATEVLTTNEKPTNQSPGQKEKLLRSTLRKSLREALQSKGLSWVEKEDVLVDLIHKALDKIGIFYRTEDGTALFFRHRDHKLYELNAKPDSLFGRLVTYLADQSMRLVRMARCIDRLHAQVIEEATPVQVYGLAYNTSDAKVIALNDFGGGMWYRKRRGQWRWKPNGSDGILFWTPADMVEPWAPEFRDRPLVNDEDHFQWFLNQPHFVDDVLKARDQRIISRALLLAPFFPSRNRTRPVPAHLGLSQQQQHDTGKTTWGKMIGILFVGRNFQPTSIDSSDKGKEALHLSLTQQPYVLLDNVDTDIPWLNNFLCTYATGQRLPRRKLYTDATLLYYEPRGPLCLTSRKAKFTRVDTASRILPFRFSPITEAERKTEWELLDPVIARRGQIWAGVLTAIARVQDALPSLQPPNPTSRLADFDQFGWCVAAVYGEQDDWQAAMSLLKAAQSGFALEDEPLIPALGELLKSGDTGEQPTSDLYKQVSQKAAQLGLQWEMPNNAAACTKRINQLRSLIESVLDVRISTRILHGQTLIEIKRGGSWETQGVTEVTGPVLLGEEKD